MPLKLVFALLLCCNSAFCQISDGFSDGDFSNNPSWTGTGMDFTFTNSIFSPDNDGFENVLQVNYQLQEEGVLGRVEIYDDKSRPIKALFQNMLLGSSGTFTWDGIKNDGQKGSIGTYVMVFEAFSTDGSVFFTKVKAFTLAGKI
ncbi:MAG: hypothetical protein QNK70_02915 [Crocinitomicaceae bacterium]